METKVKNQILMEAKSATEALNAFVKLHEADNGDLSLAKWCQIFAFGSRGNLSLIFAGKRKIPRTLISKIAAVFQLNSDQNEFFQCLVELDKAKNSQRKKEIQGLLATKGASLGAKVQKMPREFITFPLAFELYAAFGLFGGKATLEDLVEALTMASYTEIKQALAILAKYNLISKSGDVWKVRYKYINFDASSLKKRDHLKGLELNLQKSIKDFKKMTDVPPEGYLFSSQVLSVDYLDYRDKLRSLRRYVEDWQSDVESSDADQLIRLQIQVYPLLSN